MKIIVSYTGEEEQEATGVLAALLAILPGAKVNKNEKKTPFFKKYLKMIS